METTTKRVVTDFERDHPERQEDEVFLGNYNTDPDDGDPRDPRHFSDFDLLENYKTKRKGTVVYDPDGKVNERLMRLHYPYVPVFVKQEEVLRIGGQKDLDRLLPKQG